MLPSQGYGNGGAISSQGYGASSGPGPEPSYGIVVKRIKPVKHRLMFRPVTTSITLSRGLFKPVVSKTGIEGKIYESASADLVLTGALEVPSTATIGLASPLTEGVSSSLNVSCNLLDVIDTSCHLYGPLMAEVKSGFGIDCTTRLNKKQITKILLALGCD